MATQEDKELLKLMSKAGFASMFVGIEAANDKDLKIYNKKARTEDNYTIMRLLREADIYPVIGFINLNPYSTHQTVKINLDFLINQNCQKQRKCYKKRNRNQQIHKGIEHHLIKNGLFKKFYIIINTADFCIFQTLSKVF